MNFFLWLFPFLRKKTQVTTTDTTTNTIKGEPVKRALCVGINDYPGSGNDLKGCVNDAGNLSRLFINQYKFIAVLMLLNAQATKTKVVATLEKLMAMSKSGDELVLTYSGHGTKRRDISGDEPDGYDEALCLYDGLLMDDEIRKILTKLPAGVKFTFLSDSCHSGTVSRAFMESMSDESFYSKPKYLPPEDNVDAAEVELLHPKAPLGLSEAAMDHILISGTNAETYSYDTRIDGQAVGAFTYFTIKILKENPSITYLDFHKKLGKYLPSSQYPQYPQLEGPNSLKNSLMFI